MGGKKKKGHKKENYKLHTTSTSHFSSSTLLIFVSHSQSFDLFPFLTLGQGRKQVSQCLASRWEELGKLLSLN